jgi:hypothetical protein
LQLQIWNEKGWQWNMHAGVSHPSDGGYTWYGTSTFTTVVQNGRHIQCNVFVVSNIYQFVMCMSYKMGESSNVY